MSGHRHCGGPGATQNQGNVLGDRPCVRQSRINREHMGGNAMKQMLGQDNLMWSTQKQEGAYSGMTTFDHNQGVNPKYQSHFHEQQKQQQQPEQSAFQPSSMTKMQQKRAQLNAAYEAAAQVQPVSSFPDKNNNAAAEEQHQQTCSNNGQSLKRRCGGRANQQSSGFTVVG